MRKLDNHGRYNLYGVFLECTEDINKEMLSYDGSVRKSKKISYRVFANVVRLYFKLAFEMLIDGLSVPLLNKFGILNVVKTKCIRYNPKRISFYKDKNGGVIRKEVKCKTNFGYWYFVFWDAPKKLRQYKFKIDLKYKIQYMDKVNDGFDYLDYTLDGYGKNASINYIHHIK